MLVLICLMGSDAVNNKKKESENPLGKNLHDAYLSTVEVNYNEQRFCFIPFVIAFHINVSSCLVLSAKFKLNNYWLL